MTAHRKRVECNATLPYIPYDKARTSWFIHDNIAYSLELAPISIFKEAIYLLMSKDELSGRNLIYKDSYHSTLAPLYYENNIDILQRWYLLCTIKRKMKLFSSREEAEAVIQISPQKPKPEPLPELELPKSPMPRLLSTKEAIKYLDSSIYHINNLVKDGKLPVHKQDNNRLRFAIEDLETILKQEEMT